jgi:hypothetical protein
MDGNAAFRRAMHILSPIFLSYYLLPEPLGGGITRTSVTLLFLGTAACIEIARIALGIRLFGMRPYEGQRVSAYAQGALGLGLAFFLFGDLLGTRAPYLVVPVFLGMAWIDPLAALARRRSWPRSAVVAAYFVLFLATEYAMLGIRAWSWQFLFAVIATGSAMIVEGPKHAQLDDDLLMLVVPLAVLTAVVLIFQPPMLP